MIIAGTACTHSSTAASSIHMNGSRAIVWTICWHFLIFAIRNASFITSAHNKYYEHTHNDNNNNSKNNCVIANEKVYGMCPMYGRNSMAWLGERENRSLWPRESKRTIRSDGCAYSFSRIDLIHTFSTCTAMFSAHKHTHTHTYAQHITQLPHPGTGVVEPVVSDDCRVPCMYSDRMDKVFHLYWYGVAAVRAPV